MTYFLTWYLLFKLMRVHYDLFSYLLFALQVNESALRPILSPGICSSCQWEYTMTYVLIWYLLFTSLRVHYDLFSHMVFALHVNESTLWRILSPGMCSSGQWECTMTYFLPWYLLFTSMRVHYDLFSHQVFYLHFNESTLWPILSPAICSSLQWECTMTYFLTWYLLFMLMRVHYDLFSHQVFALQVNESALWPILSPGICSSRQREYTITYFIPWYLLFTSTRVHYDRFYQQVFALHVNESALWPILSPGICSSR